MRMVTVGNWHPPPPFVNTLDEKKNTDDVAFENTDDNYEKWQLLRVPDLALTRNFHTTVPVSETPPSA